MADELDSRWLRAATRLGKGALGTTWPNPAVGAIVVRRGRVVGRGRTARGGRPHGEVIALAEAGELALGATLYVSLEPCSHHGKTPPCTDTVLAAGIARVVAGVSDPDPRVAGSGFSKLREAGVEVMLGPPSLGVDRAHAGHFRRVTAGRPQVVLKLAVSADDAIGRAGEGNLAITGEVARRHVQAVRSRFDAILVGRGTVEADDPELTCRLPGLEDRSPVRVVLDSKARLQPGRRIFVSGPAPTWVLQGTGVESREKDVRRMVLPRTTAGGLDLAAALTRLAEEGITRVLVEGGAKVARSFLEAHLVDEVLLFRSPVVLGGDTIGALAGLPLSFIEESGRFRRVSCRPFGKDRITHFERVA